MLSFMEMAVFLTYTKKRETTIAHKSAVPCCPNSNRNVLDKSDGFPWAISTLTDSCTKLSIMEMAVFLIYTKKHETTIAHKSAVAMLS